MSTKEISPQELRRIQRRQWEREQQQANLVSHKIAEAAAHFGMPADEVERVKIALRTIGAKEQRKRRAIIAILQAMDDDAPQPDVVETTKQVEPVVPTGTDSDDDDDAGQGTSGQEGAQNPANADGPANEGAGNDGPSDQDGDGGGNEGSGSDQGTGTGVGDGGSSGDGTASGDDQGKADDDGQDDDTGQDDDQGKQQPNDEFAEMNKKDLLEYARKNFDTTLKGSKRRDTLADEVRALVAANKV